MRYALIDTALGAFGLAWTDAGVARVALPGRDRARTEIWISREPAEPGYPERSLSELPEMIRDYVAGERVDFSDIPVDLSEVPEFNRRVYAELLKIGYGETTTYGAIARALSDLTLSRAVGHALGANPIPLIIPCHRVLATGGRTGGFSSPGGVSAKMRMLAIEHAASPTGQYAFGF
jgi:methylated-DNA-[protein]-cysteine S-methyltransferase